MTDPRTVVGIDVGTTKICTLVGEAYEDGQLRIIGVGVAPSRGLRKGVVVNLDATVDAIKSALEEAENLEQRGQMSSRGTKKLRYETRKLTQRLSP